MNALAAKRDQTSERFDTVCCVCHKVAWSGLYGTGQRHWIDAATFERVVGALCEPVSHGMCPDCLEETWREAFPETDGPPSQVTDTARRGR